MTSDVAAPVSAEAEAPQVFKCPDCNKNQSLQDMYIYRFKIDDTAAASSDGSVKSRLRGKHHEGDRFRCIVCHRLRSRVAKITAKEGLAGDWKELGKDSRAAFYAEHGDKFGDDLARVLNEALEESSSKHATTNFNINGKYMDEYDMTENTNLNPNSWRASSRTRTRCSAPSARCTCTRTPSTRTTFRRGNRPSRRKSG